MPFRTLTRACDGPYMETADKLHAWAEIASPGERCVYSIDSYCGVHGVASVAQRLEAQGLVVLFQRRLNRIEFAYIAERVSTDTAQALSAASAAMAEAVA